MDKVLRRAQWVLWALTMTLFVAAALLHTPWLVTAAWVPIGLVILINIYYGVRIVALLVRHRRERRAANAAARARALALSLVNRDPHRGAWRRDWV